MQFTMEHFTHANQIDILSKHVHNRLMKICKRGPRGKVLTLSEIERARVSLQLSSKKLLYKYINNICVLYIFSLNIGSTIPSFSVWRDIGIYNEFTSKIFLTS